MLSRSRLLREASTLIRLCCQVAIASHTHTHTQTCKHRQTGSSHCSSFVYTLTFSQHLSYVLYTFGKRGPFSNWGPYCSFCYKSPVWMPKQTHTHTQSCFTYTVWTFFCSRVLKKVKFFKPLPFPLKIVFGADFVSVFPLNILLHFETDNNIPNRLHTSYVTQNHTH